MAFPNVPNFPGVPPLPRLPGVVPAIIDLLTGDAGSLFGGLSAPVWGLFLNGEPVVTAESVVSFDYKQGYGLSSYQVEPNAFETYNKVQKPFSVRLRFSTGGTPADRAALIATAQAAVDSLDLMDAVTPEVTYTSLNPIDIDYRRTAQKGVGLLVVDLLCEQVRVTASSSFAQNPASTATGADGTTTGSTGAPTTGAVPFTTTSGATPFSTASIVSPISPSASPQVNGGTVQPLSAAPGQFDLSQALP